MTIPFERNRAGRTLATGACSVVMALLVAGCGGGGSPATPQVDASALQPGNYPTIPRTDEQLRTPANTELLEPLRMAEAVPRIAEIDPKLAYVHVSTAGKFFTAQHPPTKYDEGIGLENFSAAIPGLIAAWGGNGQRREDTVLGRNASITLMRFSDPAAAAHAAAVLADARRDSVKNSIEIPGHPLSHGRITRYDAVAAWVPHAEFMIYTYVGAGVDIPPDPNPLATLTARLLDAQIEKLRNFRPTPVSELERLPLDRDGLMAVTLPPDEGVGEMVLPPEVALQLAPRPGLTQRAFDDARVDLVMRGASSIYRAADAPAAKRLQAFFVSQRDSSYQAVDPPPGLPSASCAEETETIKRIECAFTHGRHTVVVEAGQLQDVHQKAAAQYLLLDHAE
ncbi:DUF7373 family lipoprotein [Nocardia sp. NPDC003345]